MTHELSRSLVALAERLGVEPLKGDTPCKHDFEFSYTEYNEPVATPAPPPLQVNPVPQYDIVATDQWNYVQAQTANQSSGVFSTTPYKLVRYSIGEILHALLDRVDCVNSVRAWNCDPKANNNGRS